MEHTSFYVGYCKNYYRSCGIFLVDCIKFEGSYLVKKSYSVRFRLDIFKKPWPFFTTLTRYAKLCFYLNFQPDILIVNCIYILLSGYCSVSQECISIKKCPYTKELFSQVKSTSNPDEKAQLIQAIRLRVCGEPSDRTVCCEIDQGKIFLNFSLFKFFVLFFNLLIW